MSCDVAQVVAAVVLPQVSWCSVQRLTLRVLWPQLLYKPLHPALLAVQVERVEVVVVVVQVVVQVVVVPAVVTLLELVLVVPAALPWTCLTTRLRRLRQLRLPRHLQSSWLRVCSSGSSLKCTRRVRRRGGVCLGLLHARRLLELCPM
jgi:hypothetical protein